MLRACRRLLRPGGRTAFFTIHLSPGLKGDDARRGKEAAPGKTYARKDYATLLRSAGFTEIEATDVTDEYLRFTGRLLEVNGRHEKALRAAAGDEMFENRQTRREGAIRGIQAGLLRRSLFVARRPG